MKEVFDFSWEGFKNRKILVKPETKEELREFSHMISEHFNCDISSEDVINAFEEGHYIVYTKIYKDNWDFYSDKYRMGIDSFIKFKNIKLNDNKNNNLNSDNKQEQQNSIKGVKIKQIFDNEYFIEGKAYLIENKDIFNNGVTALLKEYTNNVLYFISVEDKDITDFYISIEEYLKGVAIKQLSVEE